MRTTLAAYELGEEIGAGGMGRVFAARIDARIDGPQPVVVKLLHESLSGDAFYLERFAGEASAARRIHHPNVVRVLDDGVTDDGLPYLVMNHIDGDPLGELVRDEGPFSVRRTVSIGAQILAGLDAIHATGLVHGDIKSDNVLVDDSGHATIIDLGLARSAYSMVMTEDGMISGTPEYMAPEVIRGEPLSIASEIYAVGIILYEMLTGTTPFRGGSSAEVCLRHVVEEVTPPSERIRSVAVPVALETSILRALAKSPEDRYATAADLAADLADAAIPPGHTSSRRRRLALRDRTPTRTFRRRR